MFSIVFTGIVMVMSIFVTEIKDEKIFKTYISIMFFWLSWAMFTHMMF